MAISAAIWLTASLLVALLSAGWTWLAIPEMPSLRACIAHSKYCWACLTSSGTLSFLAWLSSLVALLAAAAILLCTPTAPPEPLVFDSASNTSCPV